MTEYYTKQVRFLFALWGATIGLGVVVTPLALFVEPPPPIAALVVCPVVVVAGVWRGATLRVVADDTGLVVRNLFRTYVVRWADVEDVDWCRVREIRGPHSCPCVRVRGRRRRIRLVAMSKMGTYRGMTDADKRFTETVMDWRSRITP